MGLRAMALSRRLVKPRTETRLMKKVSLRRLAAQEVRAGFLWAVLRRMELAGFFT
jgi:hypothetical protein